MRRKKEEMMDRMNEGENNLVIPCDAVFAWEKCLYNDKN